MQITFRFQTSTEDPFLRMSFLAGETGQWTLALYVGLYYMHCNKTRQHLTAYV